MTRCLVVWENRTEPKDRIETLKGLCGFANQWSKSFDVVRKMGEEVELWFCDHLWWFYFWEQIQDIVGGNPHSILIIEFLGEISGEIDHGNSREMFPSHQFSEATARRWGHLLPSIVQTYLRIKDRNSGRPLSEQQFWVDSQSESLHTAWYILHRLIKNSYQEHLWLASAWQRFSSARSSRRSVTWTMHIWLYPKGLCEGAQQANPGLGQILKTS